MHTDPLIFPTRPRGRGTLKANLLQAFGPDHLRFTEVPDPSPGPGEVMIRVVASGVNPVDYYTVTGMRNVTAERRCGRGGRGLALQLPVSPAARRLLSEREH